MSAGAAVTKSAAATAAAAAAATPVKLFKQMGIYQAFVNCLGDRYPVAWRTDESNMPWLTPTKLPLAGHPFATLYGLRFSKHWCANKEDRVALKSKDVGTIEFLKLVSGVGFYFKTPSGDKFQGKLQIKVFWKRTNGAHVQTGSETIEVTQPDYVAIASELVLISRIEISFTEDPLGLQLSEFCVMFPYERATQTPISAAVQNWLNTHCDKAPTAAAAASAAGTGDGKDEKNQAISKQIAMDKMLADHFLQIHALTKKYNQDIVDAHAGLAHALSNAK